MGCNCAKPLEDENSELSSLARNPNGSMNSQAAGVSLQKKVQSSEKYDDLDPEVKELGLISQLQNPPGNNPQAIINQGPNPQKPVSSLIEPSVPQSKPPSTPQQASSPCNDAYLKTTPGLPSLARPSVKSFHYEGHMKGPMRDGFGTQIYPDGTKYSGVFRRNKFNGQGRLELPGGDSYEGQWVDNAMEGIGQLIQRGVSSYVGSWKGGVKNGFGKEVWEDGGVYEGEYLNNERHGQGCYEFPTGESYTGQFVANKIEGWVGAFYSVGGAGRPGRGYIQGRVERQPLRRRWNSLHP